ncbi:uncharacterized protein LOC122282168 [Carya illinoinensis]|uniref:uncharacterized protein LOC122282168 n=1 Tax=Carya illinoinensis TaxID=32201 RepID=UPI001C71D697|nr:uncharacterized protein LOC122282168 [Carya illinoinensis]
MNFLVWNCRGLGNPRTVRELRLMVKEKDPRVIFLSETKSRRTKVETVRNRLGFECSFVVDSIGRSGGLVMMWKQEVCVELHTFSNNHISLTITVEEGAIPWRVTGFYGNPVVEKRRESWELLKLLKPVNNGPWLCMGDFNEILCNEEKEGAASRPFSQMERFREALYECDLVDLGYIGAKYTWSNKREGRAFTKERLDRGFGNSSWIQPFENCYNYVLPTITSDHAPLLISCCNFEDPTTTKRKIFRYEASWGKKPDCKKIIQDAWNQGRRGTGSMDKIKASLRKQTNTIRRISDERGNMVSSKEGINSLFQEYFKDIFSTSNPSCIAEAIDNLQPIITEEMNGTLRKAFTVKEIKDAVFDINPLSAPGPDGFSAGTGFRSINDTFIVLIPKKNPIHVTEYRPISLCNVIYKVVSKVLANRLKQLLPDIISPAQSAFVPGRLISDNITVAYEAMHSMKHRMRGKKEGYMALKLDMSKAYDRIEWAFIEAVLVKIGFEKEWIMLIMQCVTTVQYSILINGSPQKVFNPSRGLRQGDPISPYLFLICTEVLGNILDKAEGKGLITGFPFAKGSLLINHLFFADDSLLFCKANVLECCRLLRLLKLYETASGQRLNLGKTTLFFSSNTLEDIKEAILHSVGLREARSYEKYLGLPSYVGKHKKATFRPILESIRSRMQNWTIKFLSQAGKEVLLKAIVQAIPTYCMSIFKLPKSILNDINRLMQQFWWALLAKQGWRILQQPNSLAARVLKAKYFHKSNFMQGKLGSNPSYLWRSFLAARPILMKGLFWNIGNGEKVKIWHDKWIPKPSSFKVQSTCRGMGESALVSELIDKQSCSWKTGLIHEMFETEEANMICRIPLSITNASDKLVWRGSKDGLFSVKSAYYLLNEVDGRELGQTSRSMQEQSIWSKIWKLKVPNATKMLLWRASLESLPTKRNLFKRKIIDSPLCPVCLSEEETVTHALGSYKSAQDVWGVGPRRLQKLQTLESPFSEVVSLVFEAMDEETTYEFAAIACQVWKRRNHLIFEDSFATPESVVKGARQSVANFQEANRVRHGGSLRTNQPAAQWSAPPLHTYKANWDATVDRVNCKIGIGVVIRDSQGRIYASLKSPKDSFPNAHLAESLAALRAVTFCKRLSLARVILEGDAQQVVKAIQDCNDTGNSAGVVIRDIKQLLTKQQS